MGRPTEAKHREATYQHLCAEILRECADLATLTRAAQRAANHPDVRQDTVLGGMLRSFVAEREAALRANEAQKKREAELLEFLKSPQQPQVTGPMPPTPVRGPSRSQVMVAFDRLRREFEDRISHFDDGGALAVLTRIDAMYERYPDWIESQTTQRCRAQLTQLLARQKRFNEHIGELERRAVAAAKSGDHERASAAVRRLSSIHAAQPMLLPEARYRQIREAIVHAGEEAEYLVAARELIERERSVASEIRHLARVIRQFHDIARQRPHDERAYRAAEIEYNKAVRELRSHDNEWLAGLILELETLLDDLHDTSGQALAQLDRFLASVRHALQQLHTEIRAIQHEQARH